jgi:hypothetical protein
VTKNSGAGSLSRRVPVLGVEAAYQLATAIWGLDKAEHVTELFDAAATAEDP